MGKVHTSHIFDTSPIEKTELFSSLLEKDLAYINSRSGILQLRRGARLFSAGDKAERFFVLREGSVRIFKTRPDGGEDDLAEFDPGDTIGDFDFARGASYDACAEASADTVLIVFPGPGLTMDMLAREAPHTVSRILLSSIVMLTSRIKTTQKTIVENISWIHELQRRAYEDPGTGLWKQSFLIDEINRILEEPTALIMLKPDRFKALVDARGHGAGDEAMVRIAMVLKNITRKLGRGWALRFKSNEVGLLITKCGAALAERIVRELHKAIAGLDPVPEEPGLPEFRFTGTVVYGIWPEDEPKWDALFLGTYSLLLDTWKSGGNTIVHLERTSVP
ncbi:cyclic nucleotide-binding domain-containing protein [Breznakiella homolactica]|uniref:cyclic nucleotide-binding domain-containing protein n=1 Tax=Breznakiella homolactica TaxID=2798577 RepID=UPI001CBA692C|nr:cyclic nucleotide-binding domain-containing protein [Breznakiella homolactica]